MKQHITVEQLNELSEKGKKRLREWWKPQDGDHYAYYDGRWKKFRDAGTVTLSHDCDSYECCDPTSWISKRHYPLLSIGQMIEFLGENIGGLHINTWSDAEWSVTRNELSTSNPLSETTTKKELCDALWSAVKEVLEK